MTTLKVEVQTLAGILQFLAEYEQQIDAVERLAYHLFEQRGAEHGRTLDDWLAAQHQILCLPQACPREEEDSFQLLMSLRGFRPKEVKVVVSLHDMVIRAQSSEGRAATEFRLKAMSHYRFRDAVDPAEITAQLEDGLLRVVIPKRPA